tara:strand:- start:357 stop:785 length:429 start_codon:yes stop_codon:yes gene_type:complete
VKLKYIIITCFILTFFLGNKSIAEIEKNNFYTCDSIKYPKYSFGFFLNKDSSAKVFKIDNKKFLYYKINYNDYVTFINLSLNDFLGININLIEDESLKSINFYEENEGKYLGGCIKAKDEITVKCKLINFDLISRKKRPIDC